MESNRIFYLVICSLLLASGCAPGPVTLKQGLVPKDVTTYKVTQDEVMSLTFEGERLKDDNFKDKRNHTVIEMTFTQQIQEVDSKGNAIADITIKKLKYLQVLKNDVAIDFDSTREKDQSHPLAKLIGQSYTIKIEPTGKVAKVVDTKKARAAIKGVYLAKVQVSEMLSPDKIKERHGALILPAIDENPLQLGDGWSSTRTFTFPIVGPQPKERIYTLKEIKKVGNRQIAVVDMTSIPSVELSEQLHKDQVRQDFADMFSSSGTYSGQLEFDTTTGKVEKYSEKMVSEWVVVDPESSTEKPNALKMGAVLIYKLERID